MTRQPLLSSFRPKYGARRLAATWFLTGIALIGAHALADDPNSGEQEPSPPIELWRGIRRVGTFPNVPLQDPALTPLELILSPAPPSFDAPAEMNGSLRAPNTSTAGSLLTPMPLSEEPGQMPELGMPTRPTAPDKSTNADRADAIEHSSQDARSMKSATDAVDSIPPVHDWHGSFTQRPSDQQMETRTASGDALLHAVSMFAAALLAPVVLLAGLYILLQRMKNQPAPIIRVEYVGGQPTIHNEQLLGLLQAAAQRQYKTQPELTPDSPEISSTAEQFELGPTYEEERVQREQQARQEEEGLLLKIYEDNLGMQRQLRERLAVAA